MNNKMAINTYINNYFKCKWIKCSNQDIIWLNRNETRPLHVLSTRDAMQMKDTTDRKERDGQRHSMEMETNTKKLS